MTQQPGKGSEYRQDQAQDPTSFKDSLLDATKHRQRALLAEAEEVLFTLLQCYIVLRSLCLRLPQTLKLSG